VSKKTTSHHQRKRRQVLARDGIRIDDVEGYQVAYIFRCYLCLAIFPPYELELEHKLPKSRGGSDHLSNLGLACEYCNSDKANMTVEEYMEWRGLSNEARQASMKYQGRRRLSKGLTYALSEYWPDNPDDYHDD
jgi:5-methylcytosine-specific restriction endonuclease McrA